MIDWYRKRKRAEYLGHGHTGYWYDPETGDVWMANTRLSPFAVPDDDGPQSVAQMLHLVHLCDLSEAGEKYLPEKYASQL